MITALFMVILMLKVNGGLNGLPDARRFVNNANKVMSSLMENASKLQ